MVMRKAKEVLLRNLVLVNGCQKFLKVSAVEYWSDGVMEC
jgi:hypothetical protein